MKRPFGRERPAVLDVTDPGDRPTAADERWDELAEELEFSALTRVRSQAEGWRNGLGTVGALAGGLTLVKTRGDLDALPPGWRAVCVGGWALALALLAVAFLLAVRAVHGPLGSRILASGPKLRDWTRTEAARVAGLVRAAAFTAVVSLAVGLASAVCFLLAPAGAPATVRVRVGDVEVCAPVRTGTPLVVTAPTPAPSAAVTAVAGC